MRAAARGRWPDGRAGDPGLAANIGVRVVLDDGQAEPLDRLPVFKTAEVGEKRIGMLGVTRNERVAPA